MLTKKRLMALLGFALTCALSLPGAFAQDDSREVRTDAVECDGEEEIKLKDVEIRSDGPVTVRDDCELDLKNVVIRTQNTAMTVSGEGEVEMDDVEVYGNVSLSDDAELEMENSTIHGDISLTGESEADLDDSSVTGDVDVSDDAEFDD